MNHNDANPVASTDKFRMRKDMQNAPTGKKLLLINEGGVLVVGTLTNDNRGHFVEWQFVPKRAF
jgi:hypothetical protein